MTWGRIACVVCLVALLGGCRRPPAKSVADFTEQGAACYPIKTLNISRCSWEIAAEGKSFQLSGSLYIKPDSICYFRGVMLIEVFRGLITRDSFAIINRLERVCYKGDNRYLSRKTGCPVHPTSVYLLFAADRCPQLWNDMGFDMTVSRNRAILRGQAHSLVEMTVGGDDRTETMVGSRDNASFQVDYRQYRSYPRAWLPQEIAISAQSGDKTTSIRMIAQETVLNTEQPINFKIPNNYRIKILR